MIQSQHYELFIEYRIATGHERRNVPYKPMIDLPYQFTFIHHILKDQTFIFNLTIKLLM